MYVCGCLYVCPIVQVGIYARVQVCNCARVYVAHHSCFSAGGRYMRTYTRDTVSPPYGIFQLGGYARTKVSNVSTL